jgi:RNA-dependent RNA polymerase
MEPGLLPTEHTDPADYTAAKPVLLERPAAIEDVCDFVVNYISSDVLVSNLDVFACVSHEVSQGLLSTRHLLIAGTYMLK